MSNIPFVSTYQTEIFILDSPHSSTSYDTERSKKDYSGEQWHLWQSSVNHGCLMSTGTSIGGSPLKNFDVFSIKI